MVRSKNKDTRPDSNETMSDISRTGDERTNDFNLIGEKIPPLSTIRTQLRNVRSLLNTSLTVPIRTEFDRLRIGLNLGLYGEQI